MEEFVSITEGKTRLLVPKAQKPEDGVVFYNPVQKLSRDISVCLYDGKRFCDPLAASGARGIRLTKERKFKATLSDRNPRAIELIEKNAKANKVKVEAIREDANRLLSGRVWDCVDIDPFGSPVPFLDLAVRSAKKIIGMAATDTAALCGVYPEVCRRRYMAATIKPEYFHEVGMRVLAGYAVRCGAKYDVALSPILAHSSNHYYRVYFSVSRGAGRADAALEEIGYLHHCPNCLTRLSDKNPVAGGNCPDCGTKMLLAGPLYTGRLWDKKACEKALRRAKRLRFPEAQKLITLLLEEMDAPPWHYDLHALCSIAKIGPPKLEWLFGRLKEKGFSATRTHFSPKGFRTDAPVKEILSILNDNKSP